MMITSQIQNTHLNPNCVQPPVTGKQFRSFDFNVYKHENVNMVNISWEHYNLINSMIHGHSYKILYLSHMASLLGML